MSEIKLNLLDSQSTVIATVHGSVGDRLVAALSAGPETINELEAALRRFEKCESIPASSLHRRERRDIDEEPYDAGILVIDLAARIVACDSSYSLPGRDGTVEYHNGKHCTGFALAYRLPNDWLFLLSIDEYQARAERRRQKRAAVVPLDTRAVMYGEPLLNFIIQNVRLLNVSASDVRPDVRYALACRDSRNTQVKDDSSDVRYASACRDSPNTQLEDDSSDVRYDLACRDSPNTQLEAHSLDSDSRDSNTQPTNLLPQAVVDIHRRWLMTPRDDLNNQSPREILFAKRDLIDFDLNSRMLQWSYFLEQPPPLSRNSYAYRFAGFGTHEWVMYYDLVRFLIWAAVDRVSMRSLVDIRLRTNNHVSFTPSFSSTFIESQHDDLSFTPSFSLGLGATEGSETVSTVSPQTPPQPHDSTDERDLLLNELEALKITWLTEPNDDLEGSIPFQIIDNERRRLPEAMTGRSMVIDENCPCCKMMGDESEAGLGIYFCHYDGCNMEDEFAFSWCATLEEWEEEQRKNAEWDREWELKRKEGEERIVH